MSVSVATGKSLFILRFTEGDDDVFPDDPAPVAFRRHPHRPDNSARDGGAGHDTRALQAWLGHRNIQHTVRYTELAPDRFKNFWR
jgi:integrase